MVRTVINKDHTSLIVFAPAPQDQTHMVFKASAESNDSVQFTDSKNTILGWLNGLCREMENAASDVRVLFGDPDVHGYGEYTFSVEVLLGADEEGTPSDPQMVQMVHIPNAAPDAPDHVGGHIYLRTHGHGLHEAIVMGLAMYQGPHREFSWETAPSAIMDLAEMVSSAAKELNSS